MPGGLHCLLLTELHCTPLVAHPGMYKTIDFIVLAVWWPKLWASVVDFVHGCDTC